MLTHMPRQQILHAVSGGGIHALRDRRVRMRAQPLLGVILEEARARSQDQGHAVASVEGQTGGGHDNVPWVLGAGIVVLDREGAVLVQHVQLSFIFKTVLQFAH